MQVLNDVPLLQEVYPNLCKPMTPTIMTGRKMGCADPWSS